MVASIRAGLRAAVASPRLSLLIWAWYALLAFVPVFPVFSAWNAALGASPEAAKALRRFDFNILMDVTRDGAARGAGSPVPGLMAALVVAAISSAFVFGGILEVLSSAGERRSLMHRFFRGGGHFFGRFFRLSLIAVPCALLAAGAASALVVALTSPFGDSEWEPAGSLASAATVLAVIAAAGLFLLALDYARIRVARDDSRGMLKAYVGGLGFALRNLASAYGVAIAFTLMLAAIALSYFAYETNTPAAGSWGAIAALALVLQVLVFARVFLRVAMVGAERHLDLARRPAAARAPSPVPDMLLAEAQASSPDQDAAAPAADLTGAAPDDRAADPVPEPAVEQAHEPRDA